MTMFLALALSLSTPTTATHDRTGRGGTDTYEVCAPPVDFCEQLHKECSSADLSLSDCDDFELLCERDPCAACEATIERCEASNDTECKYIVQHCEEGLAGCCAPQRPDDVIRGCAPDPDMCDQLGEACGTDGLDASVCGGFVNLCKGARQLTCEAAAVVCEQETGGPCESIHEVCAENLIGCAPPKCEIAGTMTDAEAVAFCYANPSRLEGCGEAPDAGHCLSLMTWKGCKVTTCEWAECMADLEEDGDTCPVKLPASCTKIHKCDIAENG